MASTKKPTGQSREWIEHAWDWAQDAQGETGLLLQISLYPTGRKGIWAVSTRLLHVVDRKPAGIAVQVKGEYPNARQETFGAFLANQIGQLGLQAIEHGLVREQPSA